MVAEHSLTPILALLAHTKHNIVIFLTWLEATPILALLAHTKHNIVTFLTWLEAKP